MRGGKRAGAGRPLGSTKPATTVQLVAVRLADAERLKAADIGQGNISAGIRLAIKSYDVRQAIKAKP